MGETEDSGSDKAERKENRQQLSEQHRTSLKILRRDSIEILRSR